MTARSLPARKRPEEVSVIENHRDALNSLACEALDILIVEPLR
jgi:hypothetical protein